MAVNQPITTDKTPGDTAWELEVTQNINTLEQRFNALLQTNTTTTNSGVRGGQDISNFATVADRDFLQTQINGKQDLIAGASPTNWNELAREDELMADTSFSIPASDYGTAFVTSSDVFTRTLQYRGEDVVEVRVSSRPIIGIGITNEYTYNYTALNGWNITSVNPAEGAMIEHPGRPETDISIVLQRRRYTTPAELTAVANTAQNNLGDVTQAAIDATDFTDFQRRLGLL